MVPVFSSLVFAGTWLLVCQKYQTQFSPFPGGKWSKQNASEYGPMFLGIIKTLILVYLNLPSSISSIFCSLCHTQCDLFDSVVREHQEKRLCMLMSLNMPLEPGKRRGRRGGGANKKKKKKKYIYIYIYIFIVFFFGPPLPLPTPPPVGSLI